MDFQILIISGVARSGKSTLARRLSKQLSYSYLGTDDIRYMIEKRFTDAEERIDSSVRNDVVWPYVESLIRTRHKFGQPRDGFILEGDILKPKRLSKISDLEKVNMACLACPNISKVEKFRQIREYKQQWDWTDKLSDGELEKEVDKLIARSKKFERQCKEFEIPFFDTSDFEAGVERAYEYFLI